MSSVGIFDRDLDKNTANYTALSPLSYLRKAAQVHGERLAVVHGERRLTWHQVYARARRLASMLERKGIGRGDTVAAMLPNTPAMVEMHFGPAMIGAVLNTLNTRLDVDTLAFMLEHGEAKALFYDREYAPVIAKVMVRCTRNILLVEVDDAEVPPGGSLGVVEYEDFIAEGDPEFVWSLPDDEWSAIALNYTSGTTGNPKGVVYHHRGAYLNAVANILDWGMTGHPVYLWTLPMFHCNGWCFPWTMAAIAGVNVCLRKFDAKQVFDLMREHGVTHFCGAPIIHSMLVDAPAEWKQGLRGVQAQVAGAAPPAAVIKGMEEMGFNITHVYGLTEVYGPVSICVKQESWEDKSLGELAELNSRQGVACLLQEDMAVLDPLTMMPVPWDGKTVGEIMFRGNITMKGYLKNPEATRSAFEGDWFRTGDLAVMHADGYTKICDRSKDVIISGGENISSLEVEDVLCHHPQILSAAVVAQPNQKWGETPCAFVELKDGADLTPEQIIAFCREHLASYKIPREVIFGPLPRTSTGKVQKFALRAQAAQRVEEERQHA